MFIENNKCPNTLQVPKIRRDPLRMLDCKSGLFCKGKIVPPPEKNCGLVSINTSDGDIKRENVLVLHFITNL